MPDRTGLSERGGLRAPDLADPAHGPDACLGDAVRGHGRGDPLLAGGLQHPGDVAEDALDPKAGPALVVAVELVGDVDDPAGVDDEVRRVEDPGLRERIGMAGPEELVVRRPRDGRATQLRDRLVVDDAPEGTGDEDIAGLGMNP